MVAAAAVGGGAGAARAVAAAVRDDTIGEKPSDFPREVIGKNNRNRVLFVPSQYCRNSYGNKRGGSAATSSTGAIAPQPLESLHMLWSYYYRSTTKYY